MVYASPDRMSAARSGHLRAATRKDKQDKQDKQDMGKLSRDKGARIERELVRWHARLGVKAERVPLSGATGYQDNKEDLDVYIHGPDAAPAVCQVKGGKNPSRTLTMRKALGDADALFLRYDAEPGHAAEPPLVVVPWRTWARLLTKS